MPHRVEENETGMMIYVETTLYREFKSLAAFEGKTAKGIVTDFIKSYIEEARKKNGPKDKKNRQEPQKKK